VEGKMPLERLESRRLAERRRGTGSARRNRDYDDGGDDRRIGKEPRTPQTAEPALGAAMIVVVHLDASCLSLDRVHQLPFALGERGRLDAAALKRSW
jgi:hypothetical protein